MMGAGPITFSYATWEARYPEFAAVSSDLAQLYFNEACLYVDNTGNGPVEDAGQLTLLLNMATAHIAWLNNPAGSNSPLVGRITAATEGSVSVNAEMPNQPGSAAWWQSSKYGAALWAATAQYRSFRYRVPRPRSFDPFGLPFRSGW